MHRSAGLCPGITRAWILGLALFLAACFGGNDNIPPVADAGPDQTSGVLVGDAAVLDGSASSDANGDPLAYSWSLTTMPTDSTATLNGAGLFEVHPSNAGHRAIAQAVMAAR